MNAIRSLALTLITILTLAGGNPAWAEEEDRGTSGHRSATAATLLSVLGTAIPVAQGLHDWKKTGGDHGAGAILGGFLLGPSIGHFYAGNSGAAMGGIGLRLVPIVGLGAATYMSWDSPSKAADAVAVGSMALGAAMAVWDIARTSKSVRSRNEKITKPQVSLGAIRSGGEFTPEVVVSVGL